MGIPNLSRILTRYARQLHDLRLDDDQGQLFLGFDASSTIVAAWQSEYDKSARGYEIALARTLLRKTLETAAYLCQLMSPRAVYVYVAMESGSGLTIPMKEATRLKRKLKERPNYGNIAHACRKELQSGASVLNFCKSSYLREVYGLKKMIVEIDDGDSVVEGEHKIFVRSKQLQVKTPVVISIDGDCVHVALLRIHLAKDFRNVYVVNTTNHTYVSVDALPIHLCYTLFALGNDFLPSLVSGTQKQLNLLLSASSLHSFISNCLVEKMIKIKGNTMGGEEYEIENYRKHIKHVVQYYLTGQSNANCYTFHRATLLSSWIANPFSNEDIVSKTTEETILCKQISIYLYRL